MPFKNIGSNDKFCRKVALLRSQSLNSASNKNHTEDWALGCHSCDNGHVTLKYFYKFSKFVLNPTGMVF